jgi:hypothetical protein
MPDTAEAIASPPSWAIPLERAAAETMARLGWTPDRIAERAPSFARETVTAWRCYGLGAAGALFDILATFDAVGLAPPPEIAAERDSLIGSALRGGGMSRGRGARSPLAAHDAALRKRLRCTMVVFFLKLAEACHGADVTARRRRQDPTILDFWRRFPGMPDPEMITCCERAREALGENTAGWRVIYDDARHVIEECRKLGDAWPGPFFLPTEETCQQFELKAGGQLVRFRVPLFDAPPLANYPIVWPDAPPWPDLLAPP